MEKLSKSSVFKTAGTHRPLGRTYGIASILIGTLLLALAAKPEASERSLLIHDAHVMTMDPERGDIAGADVLIRGGRIEKIGENLTHDGAERIDGTDMLLLPGLIDTHNHLWLTAMRGQFQNTPETAYFPLKKHLARHYRPEDIRIGTLLGATETLAGGVTTTVDFFHNLRSPEHFEAALQGLRQSGIRARLLYGSHDDLPAEEPIDLEHLRAVAGNWQQMAPEGLVTLGLGWRGVGDGAEEIVARGRDEVAVARSLRLPISVHSGGERNDALLASGLLGEDVQLIHATGASDRQVAAFQETGASLSLTPITEHRVGYGLTLLSHYEPIDRIGLGIDGPALAGTADLFANMRLLALTETGAKQDPAAVEPRRLLDLVTLEAARSIGMDGEIGSITPGKRADLILIATDALNMLHPPQDPAALVVYSAQPENIDTVIVNGEIVKRDGTMLGVDIVKLVEQAGRSATDILGRAGPIPADSTDSP